MLSIQHAIERLGLSKHEMVWYKFSLKNSLERNKTPGLPASSHLVTTQESNNYYPDRVAQIFVLGGTSPRSD